MEYSTREVAEFLNLTPQEVLKIQNAALKKMKAICKEKGIGLDDLGIFP
jgi:DNA-directed RNA polymerase sigma subunit (sigma70/sigma32)